MSSPKPADAATGVRAQRGEGDPISWIHLTVRFLLELVAWGAVGYWGWRQSPGTWRGALLAAVCFLAVTAAWGVFATPGDQSRGSAPVPIPGWARLMLELVIFGLGAAALWTAWSRAASETFMTIALLNIALTWDRHWWLLRAPRRESRSSPPKQ